MRDLLSQPLFVYLGCTVKGLLHGLLSFTQLYGLYRFFRGFQKKPYPKKIFKLSDTAGSIFELHGWRNFVQLNLTNEIIKTIEKRRSEKCKIFCCFMFYYVWFNEECKITYWDIKKIIYLDILMGFSWYQKENSFILFFYATNLQFKCNNNNKIKKDP